MLAYIYPLVVQPLGFLNSPRFLDLIIRNAAKASVDVTELVTNKARENG